MDVIGPMGHTHGELIRWNEQLRTSYTSHAIRGVIDEHARPRESRREMRYGVKSYGQDGCSNLSSAGKKGKRIAVG
jgi:hypothetical protein